jgi:hypothetical protein
MHLYSSKAKWGYKKMCKVYSVLVALIAACVVYLQSPASFAQSFHECEGLNGPALGLCKAGASVGCLGDELLDPPSCAYITSAYQAITGESPYWVIVASCPGPFANFESEIIPGTCTAGVCQCLVTKCNYEGAGVMLGDTFFSDQDATYNGGFYSDFNSACK